MGSGSIWLPATRYKGILVPRHERTFIGEYRSDLNRSATANLLLAQGDGLGPRWPQGEARTDRERLKLAFKDLIRRGA